MAFIGIHALLWNPLAVQLEHPMIWGLSPQPRGQVIIYLSYTRYQITPLTRDQAWKWPSLQLTHLGWVCPFILTRDRFAPRNSSPSVLDQLYLGMIKPIGSSISSSVLFTSHNARIMTPAPFGLPLLRIELCHFVSYDVEFWSVYYSTEIHTLRSSNSSYCNHLSGTNL
jgi:hypothetical protein